MTNFNFAELIVSNNKSENRDKNSTRQSGSAFFTGPASITAKLITGCL
jgi:hypothetical protein